MKNSPKSQRQETDKALCDEIMKAFQKGEDSKAIDLWRTSSYLKLPINFSDNYYILALKLKDMQILDYENNERIHATKDKEIQKENEKLKSEIENLAHAVDSIMKEDKYRHGKEGAHRGVSPNKYNKLRDELDHLEGILNKKETKILDLEKQIGELSFLKTQTIDENRPMNYENNPYKKARENYHLKDTEKLMEDRMMDLEAKINHIESTLFTFESKRLLQV